MQRYDLVMNYRCGSSTEEMERADDGEWIRYEDVEAALSQANAGRDAMAGLYLQSLETRSTADAILRALHTKLRDWVIRLEDVKRVLVKTNEIKRAREAAFTILNELQQELRSELYGPAGGALDGQAGPSQSTGTPFYRVEVSDQFGQVVAIEPRMLAGRDIGFGLFRAIEHFVLEPFDRWLQRKLEK